MDFEWFFLGTSAHSVKWFIYDTYFFVPKWTTKYLSMCTKDSIIQQENKMSSLGKRDQKSTFNNTHFVGEKMHATKFMNITSITQFFKFCEVKCIGFLPYLFALSSKTLVKHFELFLRFPECSKTHCNLQTLLLPTPLKWHISL